MNESPLGCDAEGAGTGVQLRCMLMVVRMLVYLLAHKHPGMAGHRVAGIRTLHMYGERMLAVHLHVRLHLCGVQGTSWQIR